MGKRAHGIVDVGGAARPTGHGRASLLVGCVGVPHGDDEAGFSRGIDARRRTEDLRRNRQNPAISSGSFEETAKRLGRRQLNPFGRMHTAPLFADERSLEMDSQNFRARFLCFVLLSDVSGDSLDGAESLVRAGGYSGGHK